MNDFWESRFGEVEYAYGVEPNEFFRQQIEGIGKGKILFPAEGEGRNALYAARKGFDVHAFDFSLEGRRKALALAARYGVEIKYTISTYEEVVYPENFFDAVVLVFAHTIPHKRREWHRKMSRFLRPGGILILEGFSKDQLHYASGGPSNRDMLFAKEEILGDFEDMECISLGQIVVTLDEGLHHKGEASVVRGVFRK